MVGCLLLFYFVNFVVGYPLDEVDEVPLPPSYMEQQSQWQNQPIQTSYGADNFIDYPQAGNTDTNPNYDQQGYEEQYPRMAAASMEESSQDIPPPKYTPQQPAVPLSNPVQPPPQDAPEPGHVIPQYIPAKKKHTDKEEEPYLTPQWQSDEGIGDGRNPKIVAALEAITADLIDRGKELTAERRWTKQVESMLELYKEKVSNVNAHSEQIRTEMKTLLKKKRQIENVEVQDELNSKLRMAQSDLEALDGAMSHVQSKADEFAEKKKKLEEQINKISSHIKNLQGSKEAETAAVDEDDKAEAAEEAQKLAAEKAPAKKSDDEEDDGKPTTVAKTVKTGKDDDDDKPAKTETVAKTTTATSEDTSKKEEPKKDKAAEDETPKKSDVTNTTASEPKFRTKKSHQKKQISSKLRGGEPLTPKKIEMDEE